MKTKKKIKELEARIEKLEKPKLSIWERIAKPYPSGGLVFTPFPSLRDTNTYIENGNRVTNSIKDHEKATERLYTIEGFAKIANVILTPDLHNDIYLSLLDSVGPTECLIDGVWTGEALSKSFNEMIFNPKTQNIVDYLYNKGITLKTKLEDEIALKCLEHVGALDAKMSLEDVKKYCQFRYSIIDKALKSVLFKNK